MLKDSGEVDNRDRLAEHSDRAAGQEFSCRILNISKVRY